MRAVTRIASGLFTAFFFLTVFSFPSHAQAAARDAADELLSIDTGRLEAMLDQVASLLHVQEEKRSPDRADAVAQLENIATTYNELLDAACLKKIIIGPVCHNHYERSVLPTDAVSAERRREVDDVTSYVEPFWAAVCHRLDDAEHTTYQIE